MRIRILAAVLLALTLGGCAFTNPKNTPLLTALDGWVTPETTGEKVALAPVFVPVGMACGALDICVVHPVQAAGLAAGDTWKLLWSKPPDSFTEQLLEFVPKAVISPVVFSFCWVGRSLFDVDRLGQRGRGGPAPPRREVAIRFAFSNRRNRRLMNLCEKHLVPESTSGKLAMAPIILPVDIAAAALDIAVVHPATVVDDAWLDTKAVAWEPTRRGYVTECALLPIRTAFTPVAAGWFFLSRVLFDTPPWPPAPDELERELLDDDQELRMLAARALRRGSYTGKQVGPATNAMLKACEVHGSDQKFCDLLIELLPRPLTDHAQKYLRKQALRGRGPLCVAAVRRLFRDTLYRIRYAPDGRLSAADNLRRHITLQETHLRRSVNFLASVFDDLVSAGHHEAEVYLILLTCFRLSERGPKALGLYIQRSLAQRDWPAYAEAAGFRLQLGLLRHTPAGRIAATQHEWRVLRVRSAWPGEVIQALQKLTDTGQSDRSGLEGRDRLFLKKVNETGRGEAMELLIWMELLADTKTLLDAAETAEELKKGTEADLRLFKGDPQDLLIKKGKP